VTNSSRSGGDAGRETTMINSAVLLQFPASVRTSVMRLVIEGVAVDRQIFDTPGSIPTADERISVFHPSGGGSIYQQAPGDIMENGNPGSWNFNMNFQIPEVGSSGAGLAGNELIALLPGVTQAVCAKVVEEAEIEVDAADTEAVPVTTDVSGSYGDTQDSAFDMTTVDNTVLVASGSTITDALDGKAFGCFRNTATGDYIFYNVLYEQ